MADANRDQVVGDATAMATAILAQYTAARTVYRSFNNVYEDNVKLAIAQVETARQNYFTDLALQQLDDSDDAAQREYDAAIDIADSYATLLRAEALAEFTAAQVETNAIHDYRIADIDAVIDGLTATDQLDSQIDSAEFSYLAAIADLQSGGSTQPLPSLQHPDAVTLSLTASGAGFLGEPLTLVGRTVTSLTLDETAPVRLRQLSMALAPDRPAVLSQRRFDSAASRLRGQ